MFFVRNGFIAYLSVDNNRVETNNIDHFIN